MVNVFILFFQRYYWNSTEANYQMCIVKGKSEVKHFLNIIKKYFRQFKNLLMFNNLVSGRLPKLHKSCLQEK